MDASQKEVACLIAVCKSSVGLELTCVIVHAKLGSMLVVIHILICIFTSNF